MEKKNAQIKYLPTRFFFLQSLLAVLNKTEIVYEFMYRTCAFSILTQQPQNGIKPNYRREFIYLFTQNGFILRNGEKETAC
jgi:hypothetical protein